MTRAMTKEELHCSLLRAQGEPCRVVGLLPDDHCAGWQALTHVPASRLFQGRFKLRAGASGERRGPKPHSACARHTPLRCQPCIWFGEVDALGGSVLGNPDDLRMHRRASHTQGRSDPCEWERDHPGGSFVESAGNNAAGRQNDAAADGERHGCNA